MDNTNTAREGWDGSNPDEWAPMPARRHTANGSTTPTPASRIGGALAIVAGAIIGLAVLGGIYLELAFFA